MNSQQHKQLVLWGITGVSLIIFMVATQPLELPLPLLLLPFIIFFLWARSSFLLVVMLLGRRPQVSKKLRVLANGVAGICLLVITLQSLGQLSWRDFLLVVSLIVVFVFYFSKTDLV